MRASAVALIKFSPLYMPGNNYLKKTSACLVIEMNLTPKKG